MHRHDRRDDAAAARAGRGQRQLEPEHAAAAGAARRQAGDQAGA